MSKLDRRIEIVKVNKRNGLIEYESVGINSYFGLNGEGMSGGSVLGEKALAHSFAIDLLRKTMGRTLTLIDASILDKQQNKAMKDVLRGIFSDEMEFISEMAFDQDVMNDFANKSFQRLSPEEQNEVMNSSVSVEEALGVK